MARLRKTILMLTNKKAFVSKLVKELTSFCNYCKKNEVITAIRFNGTSDLPFHSMTMPESAQTIVEYFGEQFNAMFYDYTKSHYKMIQFLAGKLPTNYHLTFSYAPERESEAVEILALGGNVAVVFDNKKNDSFVGKRFLSHEIISGDDHDLRFLDPQGGYVVGLTKKGRAISTKGFFVSLDRLDNQVRISA